MEDVIATTSGLQHEVFMLDDDSSLIESSRALVHYTGKFINGITFDYSLGRGAFSTFCLSSVIARGLKYRFYLQPKLGCGDCGQIDISSYALLIFDV